MEGGGCDTTDTLLGASQAFRGTNPSRPCPQPCNYRASRLAPIPWLPVASRKEAEVPVIRDDSGRQKGGTPASGLRQHGLPSVFDWLGSDGTPVSLGWPSPEMGLLPYKACWGSQAPRLSPPLTLGARRQP